VVYVRRVGPRLVPVATKQARQKPEAMMAASWPPAVSRSCWLVLFRDGFDMTRETHVASSCSLRERSLLVKEFFSLQRVNRSGR
jgi:hypothetical protein